MSEEKTQFIVFDASAAITATTSEMRRAHFDPMNKNKNTFIKML